MNDMDMNGQSQSKEVEEIIHWMVITALHDERLLAVKGKLHHDVVRDPDATKLEAHSGSKSFELRQTSDAERV